MKRLLATAFVLLLAGVSAEAKTKQYTIRPGDVLSKVAERELMDRFGVAPRRDLGAYTKKIARVNGIDPSRLAPGQTVQLPEYALKAFTASKKQNNTGQNPQQSKQPGTEPGENPWAQTRPNNPVVTVKPSSNQQKPSALTVRKKRLSSTSNEKKQNKRGSGRSIVSERASFVLPPRRVHRPPLTVRKLARQILAKETQRTVRSEDVYRFREAIVKENNLRSIDYATNSYVLSGETINVPGYETQPVPDLERTFIPRHSLVLKQREVQSGDEVGKQKRVRNRMVARRVLKRHEALGPKALKQYTGFLAFLTLEPNVEKAVTLPGFHVPSS